MKYNEQWTKTDQATYCIAAVMVPRLTFQSTRLSRMRSYGFNWGKTMVVTGLNIPITMVDKHFVGMHIQIVS